MKKERKGERFVGVICINFKNSYKLQAGETYFVKEEYKNKRLLPVHVCSDPTKIVFIARGDFIEDPEHENNEEI